MRVRQLPLLLLAGTLLLLWRRRHPQQKLLRKAGQRAAERKLSHMATGPPTPSVACPCSAAQPCLHDGGTSCYAKVNVDGVANDGSILTCASVPVGTWDLLTTLDNLAWLGVGASEMRL